MTAGIFLLQAVQQLCALQGGLIAQRNIFVVGRQLRELFAIARRSASVNFGNSLMMSVALTTVI